MRSKTVSLALAFICLSIAASGNVRDTQDGKSQLVVPMQSGAFVVIRTESQPATARDATSNIIESEDKPNLLHRVFVDRKNELFFGYELLVERAGSGPHFWVTVRPLSEDYLRQLSARPAFQKRRLHPSYNASAFNAAPQLVGDGDTFALDVLQSQRTGTKIVDVIQVSLTDPGLKESASDSMPRDFVPEDVLMQVANHKLLINDEAVYQSPGGSLSGSVLWIAMPDRGRFIFSLVPRPGYDFQKTATIAHNKISFEWGGERYEWVSSAPVVGIGGNWNIWMLHDADYSFDLFDQPAARKGESKTLTQQYEVATRRARQRQRRAELDAPSANANANATKPRPKRVRVVIGAANGVEQILPKQ
jgi:hypothetical protein